MDAIETKRIGNYLIEIHYDTNPSNPRTEWDNLTTMVCGHKRYDLGDKDTGYNTDNYDSWGEMKEAIIKEEKPLAIKPLYMYDHSGITIATKQFRCPWDSGQIGWVFITKKKQEEMGTPDDLLLEALEGEVETYDQYLRGDVYGYKIYKIEKCSLGHEHKEHVDSCWGFYGKEDCMSEAESFIPEEV